MTKKIKKDENERMKKVVKNERQGSESRQGMKGKKMDGKRGERKMAKTQVSMGKRRQKGELNPLRRHYDNDNQHHHVMIRMWEKSSCL